MSISLLAMEKIAKKAGVKRISREALKEMREAMEEYASEVAEQCVRVSRHAERKTVTGKDVKFVTKTDG